MAAKRPAITIIGGSSVDIEDLIAHEASLEIRFGGGTLNVVYDPHKVNSAHLMELSAGIPNDQKLTDTAVTLVDVIHDWDLTRGGAKVPLAVEEVAKVPWKVLNRIMFAIIRDQQVDPTSDRS